MFSLLFLAILFSVLIAGRDDSVKERNDTSVYKEHYECVVSRNDQCDKIIRGLDLLFYPIAKVISVISFGSFYSYKLIFSVVILFPILIFVAYYSINPFISLLFLFVDYRYYEYSANVLRHGLSLSIFCFFAVVHKGSSGKNIWGSALATLTHLSGLIFFLLKRDRFSIKYIFIYIAAFIFCLFISNVPLVGLSGYLPDKIQFYLLSEKEIHFSFPTHYFVICFLLVILYPRINKSQVYIANSIFIIALGALYLDLIGMGYRYHSYILPFMAIIIPYIIRLLSDFFPDNGLILKVSMYFIFYLILVILFFKYVPFYYIHLS